MQSKDIGVIYPLFWHDAYRTSRTVDKVDRIWKQLRQAVLHNGVGMPAAYLHNVDGRGELLCLFFYQLRKGFDNLRIAKTVIEIFELQFTHLALGFRSCHPLQLPVAAPLHRVFRGSRCKL